jgi:hypothetical protein
MWVLALSREDREEACRYLLREGADVNRPLSCEHGDTPLMLAANAGTAGVCQILIDAGADVNLENVTHHTALHLSAGKGDVGICKLLLRAGARVDHGAAEARETPLHWAIRHHKVVNVLLEAGAPVDAYCRSQLTPLRLAVTRADLPTLEELLGAGANPLYRPDECWTDYLTPFEFVVYAGNATRATMMSRYCDIDPDIPAASGLTLFDLASGRGMPDGPGNKEGILILLRSLRADCAVRESIGHQRDDRDPKCPSAPSSMVPL